MNPHGSKWIRPEKRARIYERDNWRCVWCDNPLWAVAPGYRTLDHVIPRSKGGGNGANNLVTCCKTCNDTRQNMSAKDFAQVVARRTYPSGKRAASGSPLAVLHSILSAVCTELPAQAALFTPAIEGDAE